MADYTVKAVFFSKGVSGVDGIVVAETALSTVYSIASGCAIFRSLYLRSTTIDGSQFAFLCH